MSTDQPSDRTAFVYTNYIKATPERIWQGLTDPALTKRYRRHATAGGKSFPSDWKKGSTYDLVHEEVGMVVSDPAQVILESDPYRRLAYTWHTFTPEVGRPSRHGRGHGGLVASRAPFEGGLRHRRPRERRGQAHAHPRRLRAG